jgi:hypothetical protein
MATIKTELCTDSKAEGVYPLSEYQFIDVKHEAVESVLKTEVKVRITFLKSLYQCTKQSYILNIILNFLMVF